MSEEMKNAMFILKNRGLFTIEDYMSAVTLIENRLSSSDEQKNAIAALERFKNSVSITINEPMKYGFADVKKDMHDIEFYVYLPKDDKALIEIVDMKKNTIQASLDLHKSLRNDAQDKFDSETSRYEHNIIYKLENQLGIINCILNDIKSMEFYDKLIKEEEK